MARFLTFDLGTTLYKVALFDDSGRLLAFQQIAPSVEHPRPQCAEVNPKEFLRVLIAATLTLKSRTGGDWSDVAAVSYATQANTFTFLDDAGDTTMDFILWTDQRAAPLANEVARIASLRGYRQSTGMPRFSPLLALAKVSWLRRHHPSMLNSARHICFLNDYLTAYFSGQRISEASVGGLSGAMDISTLAWRTGVLEQLDVPPIEMLPVRRCSTDLGPLAAEAAREFGLPASCRFIVGCLDQYAGAIGTGTVAPGAVCETTGTVLAAVRCADRLEQHLPDSVFQGPGFDPGVFFQMSFSSTSANLLEHYRNQLPGKPSFEALTKLAASATSSAPIEAFDDNGPIEAAFRHVRGEHSPGEVVRGIMERVADALAQQVRALCGNDMPDEIRSAGGAARNDLWLQLKADRLGVPVAALECEEPTSLGAAMLAARALGLGTLPQLAERWVKIRKVFVPGAARS